MKPRHVSKRALACVCVCGGCLRGGSLQSSPSGGHCPDIARLHLPLLSARLASRKHANLSNSETGGWGVGATCQL